MGSQVLVALLVTVVLGDEVEVLTTDDDGTLHLGGDDLTSEDAATDGDITGEGALLVDVVSLNGLSGGLEAKTDLLVPAVVLDGLLAGNLGVLEDTLLLLESLFNLDGRTHWPKGKRHNKARSASMVYRSSRRRDAMSPSLPRPDSPMQPRARGAAA